MTPTKIVYQSAKDRFEIVKDDTEYFPATNHPGYHPKNSTNNASREYARFRQLGPGYRQANGYDSGTENHAPEKNDG